MIYKRILSSTLPLIIAIFLFLVVGNYGIDRVKDLRTKISQAKKDKAALTQKISILERVSATAVSESQLATSALPGENQVLLARTRIKDLAVENNVILSNLKSDLGSSGDTEFSSVRLSFDVAGGKPEITAFLKLIENSAPVSLVEKIDLSESAGGFSAEVVVKTFWAPFPEIIPSVTNPVTDLTAEEKNTLDRISAFVQPPSPEVSISPEGEEATGSVGRPNPFLP